MCTSWSHRPTPRPIAPVPARLHDVRFRYPTSDHDALGPVSLSVEPGEHLAVTGANGSGKTTLMLMLAGREPTSGTIERPGAVGLGKLGGTAVIMQHPESQVLGTRVADDVVWGLPPGKTTDVHQLLTEVGLDGLAERDTGGLSGGELQRLAVAAALAHEPSLLIADEVTSMVDQDGRDALMSVLSGLTEHHRMSLVHITHYNDEADAADRVVNLTGNGGATDNTDMVETASAPTATAQMAHHADAPVLELNGVGHEYASGTPWATTALRDITFAVNEGDGLLIHGLNGSGKSTLAWIMAGLTVPTVGSCLLDGAPVSDQVGAVAISFQAARLQLMRSRVDVEIASAAGFSHRRPRPCRGGVGHGRPGSRDCRKRRIDQLSGGQMRRVVLAGLLARSPRALILDEPLAGLDAASAAWAAATAGRPAPPRRSDGCGDLARLPRARGSVPPHVASAGRGAGARTDRGGRHVMTADVGAPRVRGTATTRRQRRPVVLLRPVPGDSVIHELWAGTKLLVVAGIGVLLTFYPGWVPIGAVAALVLTATWLARIPRGALPSIPRWLWILLMLGGLTATFAGGSPVIDVGSIEVGLGGLFNFLRITALSIVLLGLGAMVSWTTNVAEIAPAVATLGRPLRALRIPVDDWAVTLALALRAFPMLIDEFRVLYAARRLRPKEVPPTRRARVAVGGQSRSSICSPPPSPWRCGGPTRWATRSPHAVAQVRFRRRRHGRNAPTGLRSRSCSWCAVRRWRSSSRCSARAASDLPRCRDDVLPSGSTMEGWKSIPGRRQASPIRLRNPLSIVLIAVIVIGSSPPACSPVSCMPVTASRAWWPPPPNRVVQDKASVSFGATPSSASARDRPLQEHVDRTRPAIGSATLEARRPTCGSSDVRLDGDADSMGTVGALDAMITWSADGMRQSIQEAISPLRGLVTGSRPTGRSAPSSCRATWAVSPPSCRLQTDE